MCCPQRTRGGEGDMLEFNLEVRRCTIPKAVLSKTEGQCPGGGPTGNVRSPLPHGNLPGCGSKDEHAQEDDGAGDSDSLAPIIMSLTIHLVIRANQNTQEENSRNSLAEWVTQGPTDPSGPGAPTPQPPAALRERGRRRWLAAPLLSRCTCVISPSPTGVSPGLWFTA